MKPPTRRGFGSTVIERSIRHDLKGDAQVEFAPAGLRASFMIPAAYVHAAPVEVRSGAETIAELAEDGGRMPKDVLVVEDNMIIALDAEDIMRKFGVDTVRSASSVAQALREISDRAPEFALLDVNLGAETSFEIAKSPDRDRRSVRVRDRIRRAGRVSSRILGCSQAAQALFDRLAARGGRTLGQPAERDSGEQKRLQLFGTNETLRHNRRSATSSTRWLSTFLRMRSARWRVGKMFSSRLSRLMRVQIVTAVSTASSSDNVA